MNRSVRRRTRKPRNTQTITASLVASVSEKKSFSFILLKWCRSRSAERQQCCNAEKKESRRSAQTESVPRLKKTSGRKKSGVFSFFFFLEAKLQVKICSAVCKCARVSLQQKSTRSILGVLLLCEADLLEAVWSCDLFAASPTIKT